MPKTNDNKIVLRFYYWGSPMGIENRDIDYKIFRLLQKNGRIPNTEIAKILGISEATVRKRLQNLIRDEGIQVIAVVNPSKLQSGIMGNLRVQADKKQLETVAKELSKLDELWYIAQLVGTTDFDAEYYVSSQAEFGRLVDKINKIEGIITIETSLLIRYIKYAGAPSFPDKAAG
jgi:Lrp/AsnC family transcriptional regulator for asnA, asnC and gidA